MAKKYLSVGLLCVARLRGLGLVAVLQRRGEYNYELCEPGTFTDHLQVTAQGRNKSGEGIWQTLLREVKEELGGEFAEAVFRGVTKDNFNWKLKFLVRPGEYQFRVRDEDVMAVIFGKKVTQNQLSLIRLEPLSGGLVYVKAASGFKTNNCFGDCLLAVKAAFKIFGRKKRPRCP